MGPKPTKEEKVLTKNEEFRFDLFSNSKIVCQSKKKVTMIKVNKVGPQLVSQVWRGRSGATYRAVFTIPKAEPNRTRSAMRGASTRPSSRQKPRGSSFHQNEPNKAFSRTKTQRSELTTRPSSRAGKPLPEGSQTSRAGFRSQKTIEIEVDLENFNSSRMADRVSKHASTRSLQSVESSYYTDPKNNFFELLQSPRSASSPLDQNQGFKPAENCVGVHPTIQTIALDREITQAWVNGWSGACSSADMLNPPPAELVATKFIRTDENDTLLGRFFENSRLKVRVAAKRILLEIGKSEQEDLLFEKIRRQIDLVMTKLWNHDNILNFYGLSWEVKVKNQQVSPSKLKRRNRRKSSFLVGPIRGKANRWAIDDQRARKKAQNSWGKVKKEVETKGAKKLENDMLGNSKDNGGSQTDRGRHGGARAPPRYGVLTVMTQWSEEGDLKKLMSEVGRVPEMQALRLFLGILRGLDALNSLGIVFKDLRPSKVLVYKSPKFDEQSASPQPLYLKIGDFGFNKDLFNRERVENQELNYKAPEVLIDYFKLLNKTKLVPPSTIDTPLLPSYPKAAIWSAGCILYQMLMGNMPFDQTSEMHLMRSILSEELWIPPHVPIQDCIKELIMGCLTVNPEERITIDLAIKAVELKLLEVSLHEFLADYLTCGVLHCGSYRGIVLSLSNLWDIQRKNLGSFGETRVWAINFDKRPALNQFNDIKLQEGPEGVCPIQFSSASPNKGKGGGVFGVSDRSSDRCSEVFGAVMRAKKVKRSENYPYYLKCDIVAFAGPASLLGGSFSEKDHEFSGKGSTAGKHIAQIYNMKLSECGKRLYYSAGYEVREIDIALHPNIMDKYRIIYKHNCKIFDFEFFEKNKKKQDLDVSYEEYTPSKANTQDLFIEEANHMSSGKPSLTSKASKNLDLQTTPQKQKTASADKNDALRSPLDAMFQEVIETIAEPDDLLPKPSPIKKKKIGEIEPNRGEELTKINKGIDLVGPSTAQDPQIIQKEARDLPPPSQTPDPTRVRFPTQKTLEEHSKAFELETSLVPRRYQSMNPPEDVDMSRKKNIFLKKQGIPEITISQIMNSREASLSQEDLNKSILCYVPEKPKKSLAIKPPFNPTFYKGKSAKKHVLFSRKISGYENFYLRGGSGNMIYFRDGKDSIQEIDVSAMSGYRKGSLNTDEFFEINEEVNAKTKGYLFMTNDRSHIDDKIVQFKVLYEEDVEKNRLAVVTRNGLLQLTSPRILVKVIDERNVLEFCESVDLFSRANTIERIYDTFVVVSSGKVNDKNLFYENKIYLYVVVKEDSSVKREDGSLEFREDFESLKLIAEHSVSYKPVKQFRSFGLIKLFEDKLDNLLIATIENFTNIIRIFCVLPFQNENGLGIMMYLIEPQIAHSLKVTNLIVKDDELWTCSMDGYIKRWSLRTD